MIVTVTHSKTLVHPDSGSEDKVYGSDYVDPASHTINGLGTGVGTALGVNVGTAGAVVVNGGVLGTPLSGNLANCTGYPATAPAYPVTVTGGVSGGIPYFNSTTQESASALLAANGIVVGGGAGAAPSTSANLTYSTSGSNGTLAVGGTASIGTDSFARAFVSGSSGNSNLWLKSGTGTGGGCIVRSDGSNDNLVFGSDSGVKWTQNSGNGYNATIDTFIGRGSSANSLVFCGSAATPGSATSHALLNKQTTGIADNVATAVATFTIPNAAHFADFKVRVVGTLGAGGAIGANESTQSAEYNVNITRTAGVNAVATISAVIGQAAAASVAGANNAAVTATLSAISGAVGATNTFTLNATIARSAGSSTNHVALTHVSLLNGNATGITVA